MSDAQYAIDVAAKMVGGDHTLDQLDQLTAKLMGGGKDAEFFQSAMQRVGAELTSAASAAEAANAALDEGADEYRKLERAALQAAKAAEKAGLRNAGVVPDDLAAKASAAGAALAGQAEKLRALEGAAKAADAEEKRLAATQKNLETLNGHVNKSLGQQGEKFEKLRFGLGAAGGSVGQFAGKLLAPAQGFAKLSSEMGASNAAMILAGAGMAALTVAAVALTAALVVGAVKVAAWAVGLADANRAADLHQAAVEALDPTIAAVSGAYGDLTAETGLLAPKLNEIADSLHAAGVRAADMPAALRAAALAEAALGSGGAAKFVAEIQKGTAAVSTLAATTQAKLGGIVAKQMLGLDAQAATFRSEIGGLFGELDIEPALKGLHTLVGLFDESSVAGKTLKFLFETIFQPLIDKAQSAAYVVEAFYLGVLIGATKLYIAAKPALKAVADLLGFHDTSLADSLTFAKRAGEFLAPVFVGLAGAVVALAGVFGVLVAALVAIPVAIGAAIVGVLEVRAAIVDGITSAIDWLRSLDFATIGSNMIQGIADGITGAAGKLIASIGGAVGGAIDHAKSLLGIASPSKVFARLGGYTAEGFAGGVDAGAGEARDAVAGMVAPPPADAVASYGGTLARASSPADNAKPAAPGGAGGGATFAAGAFAAGAFVFHGVENAEDAAAKFGEVLTRLLEGDALAAGA